MRGIWSGIGLRFGLSAGASSGRRSLAVIAAMAISLISSASCNCSAVSDDAPTLTLLARTLRGLGGVFI